MASDSKPPVTVPDGEPPLDLVIDDIEVGSGREAATGSRVAVHYVGVSWSTRAEFDSSWNRGDPFVFPVGQGRVIAGWDRGIAGMRVGGRRRLIIPPHLAYGDTGAGLFIKGNETLVFIVDLLTVEPDGVAPAGRRRLFGRR
jgi:peptidylprolyl isomerase